MVNKRKVRQNKSFRKKATVKKTVKEKNKRLCYSKESVTLALQEVNQGKRISEVSQKYGIPDSTLRAKKLGLYADKKPGPATVLTDDEEKELVEWIFQCCDKGFPVSKSQLQESVRTICIKMKKKNPFTNSTPGRSWCDGFVKRHPEISTRITEKVSLNRAKVSEFSLRQWFEKVSKYLREKDLMAIEPCRIFNCDETEISLNPVYSSVFAPRGYKNVVTVVNNNEKENVTVLVTANAAGNLAPTFVLFSGDSLPNNTVKMEQTDFAFGFSNSGLMLAENFYEYVANVFEPWLTENNIKRPVILYIGSHASHVTLHLSTFCSMNEILLIALHPNATNIMQPLNLSLFRTLKDHWNVNIEKFCRNSFVVGINKSQFAPLLKKTLDSMNLEEILQSGFKKSGLCPYDSNAIDFNKATRRIEDSGPGLAGNSGILHCDNQIVQSNFLQVFQSYLSPEQLKAFRLNEGPVWTGVEKDEGLFNMWYKVRYPHPDSSNTIDILEANIKMDYSSETDSDFDSTNAKPTLTLKVEV